jgi:transcriptional regulator with XRE-family HTH domain
MPRTVSIDAHIGARLRRRRILGGMNQAELARLAGLTLQQVQKYEKGDSRIGAGLLYRFGELLGVKATYFYERLPSGSSRQSGRRGGGAARTQSDDGDPMAKRETLLLVSAYYRIKPDAVRRRLFEMVKSLGDDGMRARARTKPEQSPPRAGR